MTREEISGKAIARDEISQKEISREEIPRDEISQKEISRKEMPRDEIPQKQISREETARDERLREGFMARALRCAEKAKALGEIPVGAVVVREGKVIATGYNRRETGKNALLHAEVIALNRACKKMGGWRLSDCDLYVTLEPCPMCTGAIINARIRRVYIGTMDPKAGCMGSVCDLTKAPFNHRPQVVSGILESKCAGILSDFFQTLRASKKKEPKKVSLRSFTREDVPVLKQYCYANRSEKSICTMIDEWNTGLFEGRSSEVFAVVAGDRIVGSLCFGAESFGVAFVEVCIFSDFRGKTYGTQALRRSLAVAKEKGYSSLTARVRKNSVPACRLGSRMGFVPFGEEVSSKGQEFWILKYSLCDEKSN